MLLNPFSKTVLSVFIFKIGKVPTASRCTVSRLRGSVKLIVTSAFSRSGVDAHDAGRFGNVSLCVGICDDASLFTKLVRFCVEVQLRTG